MSVERRPSDPQTSLEPRGVCPPEPPIPEIDTDPGTYIDTMGLQLDRLLGIVHGTEHFFDENPSYTNYTYVAETPSDDLKQEAKAYTYNVKRTTAETFKRMAFDRYMDLRDHSPIGAELAQDIVKSWQKPEGYVLPIDEEVTLK